MSNSKIFEGKTTNEAIEAGLKYFKVPSLRTFVSCLVSLCASEIG